MGWATGFLAASALAALLAVPGVALAQSTPTVQTADKPSIAGQWIKNQELSDPPPSRGDGSARSNGRGRGGGGGGRGRGGSGGFGGYGRGGGQGGQQQPVDPDQVERMREALRNITQPPDHLTIAQTDSIVVVTGGDGRTTRLSPDGKKIKDENTKVERKTKWDGAKLVSEISGAGSGKITQTFSVDPDTRQLKLVAVIDAGHGQQPRTITNVYDLEK